MEDATQNFLLNVYKVIKIKQANISGPEVPITPFFLKQLIVSLTYTARSYFVHVRMKSMYLVAFICFLGIGYLQLQTTEIVIYLQYNLCNFQKNIKLFQLPIKTFKHCKGQSYTLYVKHNLKANTMCPV